MKTFLLAGAFAVSASFAAAGALSDPEVAPPVAPVEIIDDTTSSSGGILLPLILIAVIIAAVAD